ncbi:hypothetical protein BCV39_14200 [Vibrio sp. 10N.286.55.E10]|nr:hypothetical protein BCV40_03560 [Vibrio sp. 10N.286.55.E12]PME36984.1 hypothetical protein BCV39_14200 [Vibrio sp. 10N.286.55.E10]PME65509.1 hypothetical protein BCV32_18995 [Vibrio sp. 10N.286.55.C11]PMI23618.1 hypothetical protein BCU50_01400 [Vibrio sp. 10N.286.46.E10]PMI98121.1 hypothetical protein BCU34_17080 [Vibrio sp. 10N.286.45.E10]PTO93745.1 hypothetical protein CWO08_16225 [Vibrio sp. 10N.286.48.B8]PTP07294.1 hypothetical protein CWO17_08230 [Vibrio sp. 10N.286.45.A3]PTP13372.
MRLSKTYTPHFLTQSRFLAAFFVTIDDQQNPSIETPSQAAHASFKATLLIYLPIKAAKPKRAETLARKQR